MSIEHDSQGIVVVQMPNGPEFSEELQGVTEFVRNHGDCDVVMDFSQVDIVNSQALATLLRLRKLLCDCGHELVFCNVGPCTERIFSITGLQEIFDSIGSRSEALTALRADRTARAGTE
jgi:anti-anti-sigma factor